jgi:uncharacterized protein (DUF2237 family)
MARAAMASIITLVRGLINDPAGASQQFTDDAIEDQLDLTRTYRLKEELTALAEPAGTQLKFQSAYRYWESDLSLTNPAGTVLSPTSSDPISGYFVFGSTQTGVYATGFTYDVYAASAELLTLWAGRIEQDILKFSADGSSYEFSGIRDAKLRLAAQYKARSSTFGMTSATMVRDDHYTN